MSYLCRISNVCGKNGHYSAYYHNKSDDDESGCVQCVMDAHIAFVDGVEHIIENDDHEKLQALLLDGVTTDAINDMGLLYMAYEKKCWNVVQTLIKHFDVSFSDIQELKADVISRRIERQGRRSTESIRRLMKEYINVYKIDFDF